LYNDRLG